VAEEGSLETWKANVVALMGKIDSLKEDIKKMGTLADSVGITDAEKQQAYALGYQFFQQKKYDKAMTIFDALYVLDPLNADFSKAVAVTLQAQGNLPDAAMQFLMTYFFHQEDLAMALHAGRCMLEAGGIAQAYFTLRSIVDAKRYPENASNARHLEIISALLEGLANQMGIGKAGGAKDQKNVTKGGKVADKGNAA
jgi:tetratricopeptide (TPR) repeat protein